MTVLTQWRKTLKKKGFSLYADRGKEEQLRYRNVTGPTASYSFSWTEIVGRDNGLLTINGCVQTNHRKKDPAFNDMIADWAGYLQSLAKEKELDLVRVCDSRNDIQHPLLKSVLDHIDMLPGEWHRWHDADLANTMLDQFIVSDEAMKSWAAALSIWVDIIAEVGETGAFRYANVSEPRDLTIPGFHLDLHLRTWGFDHTVMCTLSDTVMFRYQEETLEIGHDAGEEEKKKIKEWFRREEEKSRLRHILTPPRKEFDRRIEINYQRFREVKDAIHAHLLDQHEDALTIEQWMGNHARDAICTRFYGDESATLSLGRFLDTYVVVDDSAYEDIRILYMGEKRSQAEQAYLDEAARKERISHQTEIKKTMDRWETE